VVVAYHHYSVEPQVFDQALLATLMLKVALGQLVQPVQ
jgi:hypothetical protein